LQPDWDNAYWYYLDLHGTTVPFDLPSGIYLFDTRMDFGGNLSLSLNPYQSMTYRFACKVGRVYEIYKDSFNVDIPSYWSYFGYPASVSVYVLNDNKNTVSNFGTFSAYTCGTVPSALTLNTHGYFKAEYTLYNNTSGTIKTTISLSEFGVYLPCRHRKVFGYSKYTRLDGFHGDIICGLPQNGTFQTFQIVPAVAEGKPIPGTMHWYLYTSEGGNWQLRRDGTLEVGRYQTRFVSLDPPLEVQNATIKLTQTGVDYLTEYTYDRTPKMCWAWNQKPIDNFTPGDFSAKINDIWWDAGEHPQNVLFWGNATFPPFSRLKGLEACINRDPSLYKRYFRIKIYSSNTILYLGPYDSGSLGIPFYSGPSGEAAYKWFRFPVTIETPSISYEIEQSSDTISWDINTGGYNLRYDYTKRPFIGDGNIRFLLEPTESFDISQFLSVTIPVSNYADAISPMSVNPLSFSQDISNKLMALTRYYGNQITYFTRYNTVVGSSIFVHTFTNRLPISTLTTISIYVGDAVNYHTIAISPLPINWSNITWHTFQVSAATFVDVPVTEAFTIYPGSLYAILWKTGGSITVLQPYVSRRSPDSWFDLQQKGYLTDTSSTISTNYNLAWAIYSSDGQNSYSDGMVYSRCLTGLACWIGSVQVEKYIIENPPEMIFNYVAIYTSKAGSPTGSLVLNFVANSSTLYSWSIPPESVPNFPTYQDVVLYTGDLHLPPNSTVVIEASATIGTDANNFYEIGVVRTDSATKNDLTFGGIKAYRQSPPNTFLTDDHSFRFASKYYLNETEMQNKMITEIQEFKDSSNLLKIKAKEFQDYPSFLNIGAKIYSHYWENICVLFLVKLVQKFLEKVNRVLNKLEGFSLFGFKVKERVSRFLSPTYLSRMLKERSASLLSVLKVFVLRWCSFDYVVKQLRLRFSSLNYAVRGASRQISVLKSNLLNLVQNLSSLKFTLKNLTKKTFIVMYPLRNIVRGTILSLHKLLILVKTSLTTLNNLKILVVNFSKILFGLKVWKSNILSGFSSIRSFLMKFLTVKSKLLNLVSNIDTFRYATRIVKSKGIVLQHLIRIRIENVILTLHKLSGIVKNLLKTVHTLRVLTLQWFSSNFIIKILKQNIVNGIFKLQSFVSKFLGFRFKILKLVSRTETSLFVLKNVLSKLIGLTHSLISIVRNSASIIYKLAGIVANLLKSVNTLKSLTLEWLSSNFNIKLLKERFLFAVSLLRSSISKLLVSTFKISKLAARIFTPVYSFKLLRERILDLRFLLREAVSKTVSSLFNLGGIVVRILSGNYLARNLRTISISFKHLLRTIRTESLNIIHSLRVKIEAILRTLYTLRSNVLNTFNFLYSSGLVLIRHLSTLYRIPCGIVAKVLAISYNTARAYLEIAFSAIRSKAIYVLRKEKGIFVSVKTRIKYLEKPKDVFKIIKEKAEYILKDLVKKRRT